LNEHAMTAHKETVAENYYKPLVILEEGSKEVLEDAEDLQVELVVRPIKQLFD
jgi:hypothetical protein